MKTEVLNSPPTTAMKMDTANDVLLVQSLPLPVYIIPPPYQLYLLSAPSHPRTPFCVSSTPPTSPQRISPSLLKIYFWVAVWRTCIFSMAAVKDCKHLSGYSSCLQTRSCSFLPHLWNSVNSQLCLNLVPTSPGNVSTEAQSQKSLEAHPLSVPQNGRHLLPATEAPGHSFKGGKHRPGNLTETVCYSLGSWSHDEGRNSQTCMATTRPDGISSASPAPMWLLDSGSFKTVPQMQLALR